MPASPIPVDPNWSAPQLIQNNADCQWLSATIDGAGRYHVASVCDGAIRYLSATDGVTWQETTFTPPADHQELAPLLAVDGSVVHLAYTRVAEEDGACGDDGLRDVGVYVRSRPLPDGRWSDAVQVGPDGDQLQGFRARGGALHLTVGNGSERWYELRDGISTIRVRLPDGVDTSVRVGDDGHARIAWSTGQELYVSEVDDGHLSSTRIAAVEAPGEGYLRWPDLVLGPGDRSFVTWTRDINSGGGCVDMEPAPLDGLYFGTDASGRWATTRLSTLVASSSMTLDPVSGRLHAIVDSWSIVTPNVYLASADGRAWTSTDMVARLGSSKVKIDPTSGDVVVFALDLAGVVVLRHR